MTLASDTIVAVATACGRGGVGIVRISGPKAKEISEKMFRPREKTRAAWIAQQMVYGDIVEREKEVRIDDGFLVFFPSPHSYTGEDVVELQTHGSPVSLDRVVSVANKLGARLAEPGEFTKRAFLNGRIDLVQAEAVAELINAESEAETKSATLRLEGKLSKELSALREETLSLLAECEASVDFPEEEISTEGRETTHRNILKIQQLATILRSTYEANRKLQTGFNVILMGRPNVGKSTLFNQLLQTDRAIVTEIPGTTRDILREELVLSGRRVRLIDTAGLHAQTKDVVETFGMEKAKAEKEKADIICLIGDATEGITEADRQILRDLPGHKVFWVWNKVDQQKPPKEKQENQKEFSLSALSGDGVEELRTALGNAAAEETTLSADGGISNDRQRELLDGFLDAMKNGELEWKKGASPEFAAFEFRQAHRLLSRLTGKDESVEEILEEIFSRFCIGK